MNTEENKKLIIYVDIDNTICTQDGQNYENAKPMYDRISKINDLYDKGCYIVYWTARGTMTAIDWRKITENQLQQWSAKYHELKMNKPSYDLYIDDKSINSERYFNE